VGQKSYLAARVSCRIGKSAVGPQAVLAGCWAREIDQPVEEELSPLPHLRMLVAAEVVVEAQVVALNGVHPLEELEAREVPAEQHWAGVEVLAEPVS